MRRNSLYFFLLVPGFLPFGEIDGQNFVISNEKMNILYVGIPNPIQLAVENTKCHSIILSTDNGSLDGKECSYFIIPEHNGTATLSIKTIQANDTVVIGKTHFRVKAFPKPVAMIANQSGGSITKQLLSSQVAIFPVIEALTCFDLQIIKYTVVVFQRNQVVYEDTINGTHLQDSLKGIIKNLNSKDRILFQDVTVRKPDQSQEILEPIIFTIAN